MAADRHGAARGASRGSVAASYRDAHPSRRRKLISLRVDEYLLELTQEVARQHGLRYQAVIRIAEGLRRAILEGADDPDPSPVVPRS